MEQMPGAIPTAEELKKLSPEERVKVLKQLEERRKKELEEEKKRVEQEIAAAEELIKETEDETAEETTRDREKAQTDDKRRRDDEQSLEERVGKERAAASAAAQAADKQYGTGPTNLYKTLENDITELDRLYGKREWDDRDKQSYQEAKQHIDAVQQYKIGSDRLAEDFGIAVDNLNRLKYRR
jgi:type I site-specific restriction-modification system R (restriction) subunit